MIQTFLFTTETPEESFHQTIHSVDVKTSIDKWVRQIGDLQNQHYSFSRNQVEHIKQLYLEGQFQIYIDKKPYFLTYKTGDNFQVVKIDQVEKGEPDFTAKITYVATNEGGRENCAWSGYRPHVKFEGEKVMTSGEQIFIDKEKVFPGETVTAEIRILSKDVFKNYLFAGQHFEVGEGSRVVGHGEILEVVNPDLKQA